MVVARSDERQHVRPALQREEWAEWRERAQRPEPTRCRGQPAGVAAAVATSPEAYNAVGVGPGIGTAPKTAFALQQLLVDLPRTLVLDADALNLLAGHPGWLPLLPPETILTPHPKEFERLFGSASDDFDRLNLLCRKAQELGVVILLKGAYTAIALPDGSCWFNSTGNPGMATGGSGDVLTGILLGLLAQGYSARDAAIIGVYWHGLAGDLAAQQGSEASLTSGDLVEAMGAAFRRVEPAA